MDRIGTGLGPYELLGIIGIGGMGVVYRARHSTLGKLLAMKVLSLRHGRRRSSSTMLREARAASRLRHPHIINVTDFGVAPDGAPFIVMELLEGRSLSSELGKLGRLPVRRALRIGSQIASALGVAHKAGIIHRDLKPENVFLLGEGAPDGQTEEDFIKVLDFGLAKVQDMDPSTRTQAGVIAGTPIYMSPEQAQCRPVDARSDVYSTGVLLYHMVTGLPPFSTGSAVEILMAHVATAPEPPDARCPEIDLATSHLILRCLDKDPDRRFASMEELRIALEGSAGAVERRETVLAAERATVSIELAPEEVIAIREGSSPRADATGPFRRQPAELSAPEGRATRVEATGPFRRQPESAPPRADVTGPFRRAPEAPLPVGRVEASLPLRPDFTGPVRIKAALRDTDPALRRWRRPALFSAGALGLALLVAGGLALRPSPLSPSAVPAPRPPAAITVEVEGLPAGARLILDGVLQGGPSLALPRSAARHELRVDAEGFEPEVQRFSGASDRTLVFRLRPAAPPTLALAGEAAPEPVAKRPRPRRPRAARPPAPEPTPKAQPAPPVVDRPGAAAEKKSGVKQEPARKKRYTDWVLDE